MKKNILNRLNEVLLWIVAVLVLLFFTMVELFNGPSLDDLIFLLKLQDVSVFEFIGDMYMTWQGRYTSFLISGLCLKSFLAIGTTFPFSIVLFVLNILIWSASLRLLYNLSSVKSVLYALVLHGLFFLTMFDPSSYFWICTKPYVLMISCGIYGFVKLYKQRDGDAWDYVAIVLTFIFVGASYEIYAPIVLLLMGCIILYLWKHEHFSFVQLIQKYPLFITAFFVALISFVIMLVAPGNWVRMEAHHSGSIDDINSYISIIFSRMYMMSKYLLFNIPYILCVVVIIGYLFMGLKVDSTDKERKIWIRVMLYSLMALFLVIVSMILNTWAVASSEMFPRASNHILLVFYIWCGLLIEMFIRRFKRKILLYLYTAVLVFLCIDWSYIIANDYMELSLYKKSVDRRMEMLECKKNEGNQDLLRLEKLHIPDFHSLVDDIWSTTSIYQNHTYKRAKLLKPNDVFEEYNASYNPYNRVYRKYYDLPFDVMTDVSCAKSVD